MNIIEQIKALPDEGYCFCLADDVGYADHFATGKGLKALAESHERLLEVAGVVHENKNATIPKVWDLLQAAIEEAEKYEE